MIIGHFIRVCWRRSHLREAGWAISGGGVDDQDGLPGPGRDRPGSGAREIETPNEGMRSKTPQGAER